MARPKADPEIVIRRGAKGQLRFEAPQIKVVTDAGGTLTVSRSGDGTRVTTGHARGEWSECELTAPEADDDTAGTGPATR